MGKPDRKGDIQIDRKARLKIPRQVVPKQKPEERVYNFDEVYLGFDEKTARLEAERCIQCPDPSGCSRACPLHNDIPLAMWHIYNGEFLQAAAVYRQTSNLPEVCGRVCPQEKLCQGSCSVGKRDQPVYLGKLESFVADYERRTQGGRTARHVDGRERARLRPEALSRRHRNRHDRLLQQWNVGSR